MVEKFKSGKVYVLKGSEKPYEEIVDRIIIKMSKAEWLKLCENKYSYEELAAQYGVAIDRYNEVCMKLNAANTANAGIQLLNKELEEKNAKLEAENENYKQVINEIIDAIKSKGR